MKYRDIKKFFIGVLGFSLSLLNLLSYSQIATAVSDTVVMYQLQTGGSGSGTATQELILLYNSGDSDVLVSDWCISYSSSSDATVGFESCVTPPNDATDLWLESKGIISFATQAFVDANSSFTPDFLMGGGIAAAGGHVRVFDSSNAEIDKLGWGTAVNPETSPAIAHNPGEVLSRDVSLEIIDTDDNSADFSSRSIEPSISTGLYEVDKPIDVCDNIDGLQEGVPDGFLQDESGDCYVDVCINIDGLQVEVPDGYFLNMDTECEQIPLEDRTIFITELYPNAPSVDTGQEFIEIYNPHSEPVNLQGYRLQVGPSYTKEYVFGDVEIGAGTYAFFSDTETGIVLPNSSGVSVRLIAAAGNTVSDSAVYQNAEDDVSWALVEDVWIFTNQITPGAANKPFIEPAQDEDVSDTVVYAPCPAGKYRNPETNRCRSIETAVSVLAPCDEDEFRNPETNRCKKITVSTSSLTPCAPGQYRNPETNRCRKIESDSGLVPCDEGEERNPETNRCRKISVLGVSDQTGLADVQDVNVATIDQDTLNMPAILGVVGGTSGYMLYEWRHEIRQKYLLFKKR